MRKHRIAKGAYDPTLRREDVLMLSIRRSAERGHANHGWLNSHHSFSFANYYDPAHMGFGPLRVINEDRVSPGAGFGTHPHQDMEIITYVLEGALEHKDSMGNGSIIRPGDVQHMSAGTGVRHSEYNASHTEGVHFLQIWIMPNRRGGAPRYGQQHFTRDDRLDRLRVVASSDGHDGSIAIEQDARLLAGVLTDGATVRHEVHAGRSAWIHVARGSVRVGDHALSAGDALATDDVGAVSLVATGEAEVLVFDLAA